jgi:hypothetical protein
MPKIPLYGQGAGPTVGVAAGQLSPRASAAAFTAPGKALAGYQKTFSDIGSVAQQFALAEKDAQTRQAISDVTVESKKRWEDFNRNNSASTVEEYNQQAADFQSGLEAEFQGKYEDYTKSQKAAINQKFNQYSVGFSSEGAQTAFNRNQVIRAEKADEFIEATLETLRGLDENDPRAIYLRSTLDEAFLDYETQGLKVSYNKQGVFEDISRGNFDTKVSVTESIDELNSMISVVNNDNTISAVEQTRRRTLLNTRISRLEVDLKNSETDIQNELADSIRKTIFASDAGAYDRERTEEFIERIQKSAATGEPVTLRYTDGSEKQINFSELTATQVSVITQDIRNKNILRENENTRILFESLNEQVNSTNNLSALDDMKEDIALGNGQYDGTTQSVKNALSSIVDEKRRELIPQVTQQINTNSENIIASIAQTKGQISEEVNSLIEETTKLYVEIEDEGGAKAFASNISAAQEAGALFSGVQFGKQTAINLVVNNLNEEIRELAATNPELVTQKQNTIKIFNSMIEDRNNQLANDPVGYLEREKGSMTTSERISAQRQLGVAEVDIRLASQAELKAFQTEYKNATDYNEKSKIGNEFINRFGPENSTMVLRNMMSQGVLTVVDNVIIANPDNAFMFDVDAGNSAESIKSFKQQLTTEQREQAKEAVREQLTPYSQSVIGGGFEDVLSRTATDRRAAHVFAMRDIVQNTAMYYMSISNITAEEAAEKAANAVINSQYSFIKINENQVRIKKGLDGIKTEIGELLDASIGNNERDYLLSIIDIPSKVGVEESITDEDYIKDIINEGRWVTSTDNTGVYLVDKTGNLVKRKADPNIPSYAQDEFVMVKFSDLMGGINQLQQAKNIRDEIITSDTSGRGKARALINNPFQFIDRVF